MREGTARRLTLVAAPLGFGKTTLLAQWGAVEQRRAVGWLSLDEDDNDPTRFLAHLIAALQTVLPHVGDRARAAHTVPGVWLITVVLPLLINDLAEVEESIVLVLDDYQVITNAEVHDGVAYLIERLPERLHLLLSTRTDPPLPLARLRARGELMELRSEALRFSSDEAASFLRNLLGPALEPKDAELLQGRTEGWPAVLYLAALSLRGASDLSIAVESFAADDRNVIDYLRAEVLARQPAELRQFLLQTSILKRLCAPLCDAVTAGNDSAVILAELERSNLLLLRLDTKRIWYRYHQLLAELLQHELTHTDPESVAVLHQRASRWYEANGMVVEAAHHATAAGDTDAAIQLVAMHWSNFLDQGHLETVSRWLAALPSAGIAHNRMLCFAAAMVASHTGSVDAAEAWLDAAASAPVDTGKEPDFTVLSAALRAWLRLLRGDIEGTITAAREASHSWQTAEPALMVAPLLPLGAALWWSQRLAEATTVLQAAARTARSSGLDAQTIFAVGFDAAAAFDDHDMARAQLLAGEAVDLTSRSGLEEHPFSAMARVVSGRVQSLRGEVGGAAEQIEQGIQLADRAGAWHISVYGLLALAELRVFDHSPAAARRLIARARAIVEALPDPGAGLARVTLAEARLRIRPAAGRDVANRPFRELSERELAVLRRLPSPLSQRELAAELYVSRNTLKTHMRAIFDKLGVRSRAEAIARARELGLL